MLRQVGARPAENARAWTALVRPRSAKTSAPVWTDADDQLAGWIRAREAPRARAEANSEPSGENATDQTS